jgi:predicted dehydrogenase
LEHQDLKIGVLGAGAIGRTHLDTLAQVEGFALAGVVDPFDGAIPLARAHGVPHFRDLDALLESTPVDGLIIATPNETHADLTVRALARNIPVLLEKPLANGPAEAQAILAAEATSRARVLVGHHRRHNPIIAAAKAILDSGRLGAPVMATVICSLWKPDSYFEAAWRTTPGVGGPILINMIHEVDLLRHLLGDVVSVAAMASAATRGHAVEDTGVALLRFASGALATVAQSDSAVGPWAWDLASGENTRFGRSDAVSHMLCGTEGALSLPDLALWRHGGPKSWATPLERLLPPKEAGDSYRSQLRHFGAVIRGTEEPLVSARDAADTLATIAAVLASTTSGREEAVDSTLSTTQPTAAGAA